MASNPQLDISTTTIGYSKAGLKNLKNEIDQRVNTAKNAIDPNGKNNTAYVQLIQTLDNYWDGEDYDKFVLTLKTASQELATSLGNYGKEITTALDEYANQFQTFQTQNANNMTNLTIK